MDAPAFTFGTLCSGIEAASEAFVPIGAECAYVSEIEPFPCGVLADRHGAGKPMRMPSPDEAHDEKTRRARVAAIKTIDRFPRWANRLPNYGDLTQIDPEELPAVDLLVAGFPCQDFSIAGLRQSLAGRRGNLTLYGVGLIHELVRLRRIRSVLLEQVPDILNTKDNAFGALLGGLVGHDAAITSPLKGGRWTNVGVAVGPLGTAAWRVEDAQYSNVAQRRERLFLVASFGDGPDPVEVLFERQGLSRHPPARREAGEGTAGAADERAQGGGEPFRRPEDGRPAAADGVPFGCDYGQDVGRSLVAAAAGNRSDIETETVVVGALQANGKAAGSATQQDAESGFLIPVGHIERGHSDYGPGLPNLRASGGDQGPGSEALITQTLTGGGRSSGGYSHDDLPLVAHALRADGFDASEDGTGRGTPLVPVAYSIMPQNSGKDYKARVVDVAQPLMASGPVGGDQGGDYVVQPIAFNARQDPISGPIVGPIVGPIDTNGGTNAIAFSCKDHGADAGEISPTMRAVAHGASHPNAGGQIAVAFSLRGREGGAMAEVETDEVSPALRAAEGGSTRPFVAFDETQVTSKARSNPKPGDPCHPLAAGARPPAIANEMAVRRITVAEANRLQGFGDFYTLIEWPTANRKSDELAEQVAYLISHGFSPADAERLAQTPDGPQYKALGNSKAVPHVRKIGQRYAAALARYLAQKEAA